MRNIEYDSCHGKLLNILFSNCQNKLKSAADNTIITDLLKKHHYGYNYWLGMSFNVIKNGWFWDDDTPVEGPFAFTNFMPGQTEGSAANRKRCSTLITDLTNSSGFGDLGKWRYEQCREAGIHGLCSSSPGTNLALIYRCVDCFETGKPEIIVS